MTHSNGVTSRAPTAPPPTAPAISRAAEDEASPPAFIRPAAANCSAISDVSLSRLAPQPRKSRDGRRVKGSPCRGAGRGVGSEAAALARGGMAPARLGGSVLPVERRLEGDGDAASGGSANGGVLELRQALHLLVRSLPKDPGPRKRRPGSGNKGSVLRFFRMAFLFPSEQPSCRGATSTVCDGLRPVLGQRRRRLLQQERASNPPPAEEDDPPPAEEDDGDDAFVKHMESVTAADRPATLLLKHVGCKWHLQAQASPIRWRAPSPVCTERLAGVV